MDGDGDPAHYPVQIRVVREGQRWDSQCDAQELIVEFAVTDE